MWQNPLLYLKGVGPKRAELLAAELSIHSREELLSHYPFKHLDRSTLLPIRSALHQQGPVSVLGQLGKPELRGLGKKLLVIPLKDETGLAELTWFQGIKGINSFYKEGDWVVAHGKPSSYKGIARFTHPEIEHWQENAELISAGKIVPFYATTDKLKRAGVDTRALRRLIYQVLTDNPYLPENLNAALVRQHQLLSRKDALKAIHFPDSWEQLAAAQNRLKFEELFFFELQLAQHKKLHQQTHPSHPFTVVGQHFNQFYTQGLPFALTSAQKRVVKEIRADLRKSYQMNRLLQGDVGSGKTMVALLTLLLAADNGYQTAMLAPTEILAEQHFATLTKYLQPLGLQVDLLTGSMKKNLKARVRQDLATGTTHAVVGTHALLQDAVQFANLGLTLIDEQHKFGVLQRSKLWQKSHFYPHNLLMTATPIPRTLALSTYGELDVSVLDELPPGRKPIRTVVRTEAQRLEVLGFLKRELAKGRQLYIVYPLIEVSAKSDLLAVEEGYQLAIEHFKGYQVGMVHGRMKAEEKEFEMRRFKKGELHVLVSTTVIEVGVDVPNASVMLVENAERFGLSQLHQLRGRVGRGAEQSFAILMSSGQANPTARQRLKAMAELQDGFRIAEMDLALRGPGEFLGTRQSGLPAFKLVDIARDEKLLHQARQAAFSLIDEDAELSQPAHAPIAAYAKQVAQRQRVQMLGA